MMHCRITAEGAAAPASQRPDDRRTCVEADLGVIEGATVMTYRGTRLPNALAAP